MVFKRYAILNFNNFLLVYLFGVIKKEKNVYLLFLSQMAPKSGGKIHTPAKPPKDPSMTYNEEHDLSFQMSNLEQQTKGLVKRVDLANLHEEFEKRMDQNSE